MLIKREKVMRSSKSPNMLIKKEIIDLSYLKDLDEITKKIIDMIDIGKYSNIRESLLLTCRDKGYTGLDKLKIYV